MNVVDITEDVKIRDIIFEVPQCATLLRAFGVDLAEAKNTDWTIKDYCDANGIEPKQVIAWLWDQIFDLA